MSTKLMRIRKVVGLALLSGAIATGVSCGDVARSSRAPMYLIVNSIRPAGLVIASTLQSDVLSGTSTMVSDLARTTVTVVMKDVTIVAPSTNNQVTITGYHVSYRRADGRNAPGVDVPHPFDGSFTLTITAGNIGTADFEIVRAIAKAESPLMQLHDGSNIIDAIADVTFYGRDAVGNDISATGSVLIEFGNFS